MREGNTHSFGAIRRRVRIRADVAHVIAPVVGQTALERNARTRELGCGASAVVGDADDVVTDDIDDECAISSRCARRYSFAFGANGGVWGER